MKQIYTIGYGNRSLAELFALLKEYGISSVVDVRSKPYSRYNSDFTKAALEQKLKEAGFYYLFMGDVLGGIPEDEDIYQDGQVDYNRLAGQESYRNGVERVISGAEKGYKICLLCSELKPEMCHRSKLIGRSLEQKGVDVRHIDEKGKLADQKEVLLRLDGGQLSLFDRGYRSRGKYLS